MYSLEAFRVKKILHSTMKENNYSLILRTIFHNRSIERVNLVKETLLSPSTITRCVAQLVDDDVIIETSPSQYGKIGRRALNLEINPNALKVLLVDIGAERINYAIGKANGDIEKLEYSKTPKKFENILEEIHSMLGYLDGIDVVAFSVPGMVNVETDTILFVPSTGWRDIKIEIPGKIVYADNEANLGMIAEAFHHEEIRKSQCSVFVTVREGFGTGLWINGEIFRGPSYTAGEFGHTTFDLHSSKKCHCGNTGCLESIISISSFFGKPSSEWSKYINELFISGDKRVHEYLDILSRALVNIVNSLNPEYLIVGGELSGLDNRFYKELEKLIKGRALEHSAETVKVLPSTFTRDNYLYGALYAVIEEYLIPGVIEKIK